jgi:hypothetical protein
MATSSRYGTWRYVPDASVARIGLDAKASRYSYQFGKPERPGLCGRAFLWLH